MPEWNPLSKPAILTVRLQAHKLAFRARKAFAKKGWGGCRTWRGSACGATQRVVRRGKCKLQNVNFRLRWVAPCYGVASLFQFAICISPPHLRSYHHRREWRQDRRGGQRGGWARRALGRSRMMSDDRGATTAIGAAVLDHAAVLGNFLHHFVFDQLAPRADFAAGANLPATAFVRWTGRAEVFALAVVSDRLDLFHLADDAAHLADLLAAPAMATRPWRPGERRRGQQRTQQQRAR